MRAVLLCSSLSKFRRDVPPGIGASTNMQSSFVDPFMHYSADPHFCELLSHRPGDAGVRAAVRARICAIGLDALRARAAAAEHDLINLGITFTVYSDATAIDRILPFD